MYKWENSMNQVTMYKTHYFEQDVTSFSNLSNHV